MWNQANSQAATINTGMYQNIMGLSTNNNNTQNNIVDSLQNINQQQLKQSQPEERKLDVYYKRQTDGPILWFAGPPNNVIPDNKPVHSVTYLNWKKQQQKDI